MVAKKVSLTLFCGCFILDCQRLMHFSCCLSERRRAQPTSRYLFTFFPALIGLGDGHSRHKLDLLLASFPSHPTRVVAKKKRETCFALLFLLWESSLLIYTLETENLLFLWLAYYTTTTTNTAWKNDDGRPSKSPGLIKEATTTHFILPSEEKQFCLISQLLPLRRKPLGLNLFG